MSKVPTEISKVSIISGRKHTRTIVLDPADLERWQNSEVLIQHAMPYLSADDREFLISGATPDEWHSVFGDDDNAADVLDESIKDLRAVGALSDDDDDFDQGKRTLGSFLPGRSAFMGVRS